MNPGRDCPSGPPWIFTITGRLPLKLAGGLYRKPEICLPSKLFHLISSGSGKAAVFRPPVSLRVQRVSFAFVTSSENTSEVDLADASTKPNSGLFSWNFKV